MSESLCATVLSFVFTDLSSFAMKFSYLVIIFYFSCLGYISTSINDGPGCLMLRCPDPSCAAAVGQDMINVLASDEDKEKYFRYFIRSYVEDNRKVTIFVKNFD